MDPQRFQRAAELFLRARSLGLSEREEYLAKECGDDGDLRASVEGLIAGAEQQLPFAELAAELGGALAPLGADGAPAPDSRIGPYRLLEKLGEGGFGVVYMAEQTEPVRRKVALKIVRQGLDTRKVIARFEAERQALAVMDHPNITRVLDAGATEHGRPYFVMELIRGLPITRFCDQHRLDTRARLELLLPVCHAVQHAHQRGIIHRDLKPSNVLVTMLESGPVPKVIDFGIAKALHAPLTDRTLFTDFRQVMGTPEYMSPEQAETSSNDIDTRTDVYSLGVLLYELLTGTTPLDSATLRQADYGELQRLLRESEPPTPSRRLVTLSTRGDGPPKQPATRAVEIARARGSEPSALGRQLRGELDWIVMKCLEKDRRRRYESASALAEDLRRYLAAEPVLAGPPSALYRLRKLAQRHRFLVAFVATLVLAIGVALTGVTWGLLNVMAERDRAMAAHGTALRNNREVWALTDLLREMLRVAGPRGLQDKTYSVQQMLAEFEAGLKARLASYPEQEVQQRLSLGEVYDAAGRCDMFNEQIELAAARAREALPPDNRLVGTAVGYLAFVRGRQFRAGEALRLAAEAEQLERQSGRATQLPALVQATAHGLLGQHRAMRTAANRAIAIGRDQSGEDGAEFAFGITALGDHLLASGVVEESLPLLEKAVELRTHALGAEHQSVRTARARHAMALALHGDLDRAEATVASLRLQQEQIGKPSDVSWIAITAAEVLCAQARGRFDDAIAAQQRLCDADATTRLASDPFAVRNRADLAELLLRCGRREPAEELARAELQRAAAAPETTLTRRLRSIVAGCRARAGDGAAIGELEAGLAELRRVADADSTLLAAAMEDLAEVLLDQRQFARAGELATAALRIREQLPFPASCVGQDRALAALARAEGRADAAFLAVWAELERELGLWPTLRQRFVAAAAAAAAAAVSK